MARMGSGSTPSRRVTDSDIESDDISDLEMGSEQESEMDSEPEGEVGSEPESEMGSESEAEMEKDNGTKDGEMEELEKEYSNLRTQEQDLLRSLTRHKDEDFLKGQAVKNQKALWDKTLELRFLIQKAFSSSNKLPQEPQRSSFCNSNKEVGQAYSSLIASSENTLNCLLELQEAIVNKNPAITQVTNGNDKESHQGEIASNGSDLESDETWLQIHKMHSRIAPFRDSSINKWQRKTQVTTGAAAFKGKLHAFNQNISEQVAAYMRDPSKVVSRMQLRRSSVGVFGEVPEETGNVEGANMDGDPELLDDSEFYQQLLKEFLESCELISSETAFYALKKQQTKKRKIVDRRASKSRKIRYSVHEKIVNFMAPEPMVLPPMVPRLFEDLFGQQSEKPAAVA